MMFDIVHIIFYVFYDLKAYFSEACPGTHYSDCSIVGEWWCGVRALSLPNREWWVFQPFRIFLNFGSSNEKMADLCHAHFSIGVYMNYSRPEFILWTTKTTEKNIIWDSNWFLQKKTLPGTHHTEVRIGYIHPFWIGSIYKSNHSPTRSDCFWHYWKISPPFSILQ